MKNSIFTILFAFALFASCKKEPCEFGHIEIHNTGTELVTIYSIPSMPVLLPGETVIQDVPICVGFDANGYECGNGAQTIVSYKFSDGEKQSTGTMVHRCKTVNVKIFN